MDLDASTCRICYGGGEEPLFSPCKCTGSVKYIHQSCWDRLCEHKPADWDQKCEVCLYKIKSQEITKPDGMVTWVVYFNALGMYLTVGLFRLILICTTSFPLLIVRDESKQWNNVVCFVVQLITFMLIFNRDTIGKRVFGPDFAQHRLPAIGEIREKEKIKEMDYKKIIGFEGPYALIFIGFTMIVNWIVHGFMFFTPSVTNIASGDNASSGTSSLVEQAIASHNPLFNMNTFYATLIIFSATIFFLLATQLSYRMMASILFWFFHFVWIGRLINTIVATYCTGCFADFYTSTSFSAQCVWDMIIGIYCYRAMLYRFYMYYCAYLEMPQEDIFLKPFNYEENIEKVTTTLLGLAWSHMFVLLHVFIPLLATTYFLPDWLRFGGCIGPAYTIKGNDTEARQVMEDLVSAFVGINFFTKVAFVVDRMYQMIIIYMGVYEVQAFVYTKIGYDKKAQKTLSMALDMVLWSPLFCTALTLYYWFLASIGRSFFYFDLLPAYFSPYQHDFFAHVAIGMALFKSNFIILSNTIRYIMKFIGCASISLAYFAFFGNAALAPIRPETLFMLTWFCSFPLWDTVSDCLDTLKYFFAIAAFALLCAAPSYILSYIYGFQSVLQAYSIWFVVGFLVTLMAALGCGLVVYMFYGLNYHLKYEYGDIVVQLINYDDTMDAENRSAVKKWFKKFVKEHGEWSMYGMITKLFTRQRKDKTP
ncbi:hypothetical protein QR680_011202 [Steinernema hermaphroditum]|uniref:RING-type E3 ubiquitin transferase n=1 Tax=Steinernema hermaphroditum TaxID=289476 RepID=A0AA39IRI3_9BILA|nr:hypothetical protein QR680_011202 [Steinernema hermaphroditum]